MQFTFIKPEVLPAFQLYALAGVGGGRSQDTYQRRDPQTSELSSHSDRLTLGLSGHAGIGISYDLGRRLVIRVESSYVIGRNAAQIVDRLQQAEQEFGFLPQDALIFTNQTFVPVRELSIGWRF